jgi:hypothetical protein
VAFAHVKKIYIIVVLECLLILVWWYSETKMQQRAVMFGGSSHLYDLLSSHAITAIVALPLFFVGYILSPRIPGFAAASSSVRVVAISIATVILYCLIWFALNWEVRPPTI